MADEHRIAKRHRVLKVAKIEIDGGGAIDCAVRNLSQSGAALDVASPFGIPETFILVIPTDGVRKPSRVVWRRESRIGVAFQPDTTSDG